MVPIPTEISLRYLRGTAGHDRDNAGYVAGARPKKSKAILIYITRYYSRVRRPLRSVPVDDVVPERQWSNVSISGQIPSRA